MATFDMIFSPDGEVIINNIQGVEPGTTQCMELTAPYEHQLGVAERLAVFDSCELNNNNVDVNETA